MNVAMGMQQWIYLALLPICELLRTAATDTQVLPSSCNCPVFLSDFSQIWSVTRNFRGSPKRNLVEIRTVIQAGGQTDMAKLTGAVSYLYERA
jgi:hypothetical protein